MAWKASGIGNDRFYVIALIIQTLLVDIVPDSSWAERLKALFNAHPAVSLRAMQFPANWQALSLDLTATQWPSALRFNRPVCGRIDCFK